MDGALGMGARRIRCGGTVMIRPIGAFRFGWAYARGVRLPRSGPQPGAPSNQLGALERRRLLRQQQEEIQAGLVDYVTIPPYPYRPRPPS
jgi:hypothetical protein